MLGYIPLGLIMAGNDPYGPTGELAGKKPRGLFSLDRLRRSPARRPAPKAVKQPEPAQCRCAASGQPVR